MDGVEIGKLHYYSRGIVVEDINIDINTDIIKVYPVEKLFLEDNKSLHEPEDIKVKVPIDNGNIDINLNRQKYIKAKWRGLNSYNRITPPSVRKGEIVELYRFGNSDIFFWDTKENNPNFRKEETIVIAVSAKDKINTNETLEDMYFIHIDSKKKFIKLHTTSKYGEFTTFDWFVNLKDGTKSFKDGEGNSYTHEAKEGIYTIKLNKEYNLNTGKFINIINGEDINIKNGKNITIDNDGDVTLTNRGNITINNNGNIDINNKGNFNVKNTGSFNLSNDGPIELSSLSTLTITTSSGIDVNTGGNFNITASGFNVTSGTANITAPVIGLHGAVQMG